MRYKDEHKQETHRRIVESASREFRTHGFEGVGIAKLMGGLNLTHGGFYAHFEDKEELVAQSFSAALQESREHMIAALKQGGISALLDYYLSDEHLDHPELGCPLPSLSAEIPRHGATAQGVYGEKLSDLFDAVTEYLPPGGDRASRQALAGFLFSALAGAVSMARATASSNPALSHMILQSTRAHLLSLIQPQANQG